MFQTRDNKLNDGIIRPKFVLKFVEKHYGMAETRVYYDKNVMMGDMVERWGTCDILLQEFVIQKTMQPCVYRFYRNARNVFRAECMINKKSVRNDSHLKDIFEKITA